VRVIQGAVILSDAKNLVSDLKSAAGGHGGEKDEADLTFLGVCVSIGGELPNFMERLMIEERSLIPDERIEQLILLIRGQKVMLDADLAELYGVETKALNRAVKRNRERFPEDFMFQLTFQEVGALRCQIGTSNIGRGGRRLLALCIHRARSNHGSERPKFTTSHCG
jgi:hypothetical protein